MPDLPPSAAELRDALRRGEISARETVAECLRRIAEDQAEPSAGNGAPSPVAPSPVAPQLGTPTPGTPSLGAFVTVTGEDALRAATDADDRWAHTPPGERMHLPPLHGLPLAHKDLVEVRGVPTTHGSAATPHTVAERDDPGVSKLRSAGAISLGKTQVPEFGLTGYSENRISAPARNPHDRSRTAGGSSGGSAAAVAAGLIPLAPGSDGGGSIRIPALACGLVGLKPGRGAIPSDPPADARDRFGAPRLSVTGPIARTARDAALLFDAMGASARSSSSDSQLGSRVAPCGPAETAVLRAEELTGLRIAVSDASPFAGVYDTALSDDARLAWEHAAAALTELGHHLEPVALPVPSDYPEAFAAVWTSALTSLELDPEQESRLMPLTRAFRSRARERSSTEHRASAARLTEIGDELRRAWGRFDAVLTPGLAFDAPRVGAFTERDPDDDYRMQCEWAPFTSMVNVAGVPAIAVPVGHSAAALPVGAQLIGRPGSEAQLLQLAAQLESALAYS